jgi:hypothetical protein
MLKRVAKSRINFNESRILSDCFTESEAMTIREYLSIGDGLSEL